MISLMRYSFLLLVVLPLVRSFVAYNILGVFPHPGKSHMDVFTPLMKGLALKGHNVTVISPFPLQSPIPNYKDVSLKENNKILINTIHMDELVSSRYRKYTTVLFLSYHANTTCENGLRSAAFQNFMKTEEKFDVIIMEFFNSDCFMGLRHKFNAPVIGVSSSTPMSWTSYRFANPIHTAYIPTNLMDYSDKMSFLERVENTAVTVVHNFYYQYVMLRQDEQIARKYFGRKPTKLRGFIMNSSLMLVNTHFSLSRPRPLVPNIVEIGGIHIGQTQPLPKNIEKWINGSTEGVIYFSFGSMIKGHTFPKDKRDAFLKAFARLPQRVLWKWENETMEGKPDNVMTQKWMPQLDILCHPNVKAFISHGGLLGVTEAVHCGVPVIVLPQFGDQHTNARALEASGGGVILQLSEATEDKVYKALKKVLSSDFRQKAKELSERFRDRPLPPLETAIYWVEYVARHRGAPHMRTAAVNMPFYQYYLIDVIAFLISVVCLFSYIVYFITRFIYRRVFKKGEKVKTS